MVRPFVARCVRDDSLRRSRESSPRTHPEMQRYRQAGAYATATFAFPRHDPDPIEFYETQLMLNYSRAVILEGDNPAGYADPMVCPRGCRRSWAYRSETLSARIRVWRRTSAPGCWPASRKFAVDHRPGLLNIGAFRSDFRVSRARVWSSSISARRPSARQLSSCSWISRGFARTTRCSVTSWGRTAEEGCRPCSQNNSFAGKVSSHR